MSRLPCPPHLWARFSELLDSALDVPPPDRSVWLDRLGGEDETLKPWLAQVLAQDAVMETGYLRERPDLPPDGMFAAGTVVGPYRLESRLGEGGMGEVWRASRADDGPRREVALKLPYAELLGGPYRQRFARERDMLAALSHPHIAQLYEAGVSADGHPFLALELVEGQPITTACTAEPATLERRIDLVREVLEALTYAHQRLIVHRDIKPSNVLVTPQGGVKLLDFGIAKLLRASTAEESHLTQVGARLATPAYAAPEQLAHGEITVGTDVFSVGVLLFELCTARRPFSALPIGPDARDAPLASQRVDAKAAGLGDGARLARALRGDLDAVIARALALDPRARYGSAEAFSRDLGRWRNGLPVAARRIGWATLGLKFARRNQLGVALGTVLALALVGGALGIAWQARRAAQAAALAQAQAHRAEAQASRAATMKDFLLSLFRQSNPNYGGKPMRNVTARDMLDFGTAQADTVFARDPQTEIEMLSQIALAYSTIGEAPAAEGAFARRLDLSRRLYGPDDDRVFNDAIDLAWHEANWSHPEKATQVLESLRGPMMRDGAEGFKRAEWLEVRAEVLLGIIGKRDEAAEDAALAVAILEKHFADTHEVIDALMVLQQVRFHQEDYQATVAIGERLRALPTTGEHLNMRDENVTLRYIGGAQAKLGNIDAAERSFAQSEAISESMLGRRSYAYVYGLACHADIVHLRGDRVRAMAMFEEGNALSRQAAANGDTSVPPPYYYPMALAREGRAAEAVPLLEGMIAPAALRRSAAEEELRLLQFFLGDAYDQVGRTEDARRLLEASRDAWMRYGPRTGQLMLLARQRWARFLLDHGAPAQAAAEFRAVLGDAHGVASAPAALASAGLARLALVRGDAAAADAASDQAVKTLDAITLGYDVRARIEVWSARAEALLARGRQPEARSWAVRAVAAADTYDAPGTVGPTRARALLARIDAGR